jgi:hypothetical protein
MSPPRHAGGDPVTTEQAQNNMRIGMNATMMGDDLKQYRWAYRKDGQLHFAGRAPDQEW